MDNCVSVIYQYAIPIPFTLQDFNSYFKSGRLKIIPVKP